ncbi:hypothetical protein [Winogradskyella sp. A2]|uniref:hypothetical protein n=1 Tax=Winogradskyella sp. A2 TaxID=3366944 RepID=UPI00398C5F0B
MKKEIYQIILFLLPNRFKPHLQKLKLGYQLTNYESSYLVQTGFIESTLNYDLKNQLGEYIPWMNYPVIEFLNKRIHNKLVVFEYGSGASTMFFAKRAKKIISIEYDKDWYKKIKKELFKKISNGQIHYHELNDSYPRAIDYHLNDQKCDVVVIDGRKRVKCAKRAFNYLSDIGVVIFDDTYRKCYKEGIDFYKKKGFRSIIFKGIKPTGFGTDQTTILYRDNNCLGI